MPRYKLNQTAYIKKHPSAAMPELCFEGTIIDHDGVPGPHMEPMDDAARAALDAYYASNPGVTLDPTRKLSVSVADDPNGKNISDVVQHQLDRMLAGIGKTPAAPSAEVAELRGEVSALAQQVSQLVALMSAQHQPTSKKGA